MNNAIRMDWTFLYSLLFFLYYQAGRTSSQSA